MWWWWWIVLLLLLLGMMIVGWMIMILWWCLWLSLPARGKGRRSLLFSTDDGHQPTGIIIIIVHYGWLPLLIVAAGDRIRSIDPGWWHCVVPLFKMLLRYGCRRRIHQ